LLGNVPNLLGYPFYIPLTDEVLTHSTVMRAEDDNLRPDLPVATLTAESGSGWSSYTVSPAPVANFGGPTGTINVVGEILALNPAATITLSFSQVATDPEGGTLTYDWAVTVPGGGTAVPTTGVTAIFSTTLSSPGPGIAGDSATFTYIITRTATDGCARTRDATITVNVIRNNI
jgi:hypothetical protein